MLDALAWFNAQPTGTQTIIAAMAATAGTVGVTFARWIARRRRSDERSRQWRELETRFDQIEGEVDGIRRTYESGLVEWSLHPKYESVLRTRRVPLPGEGDRRVQRFKSEAAVAARLWRRQHSRVPVANDLVEAWLTVLTENVHRGSSISGSGNDERGRHEAFHIERLVDASKVMCVTLAAEAEDVKPRRRWFSRRDRISAGGKSGG